MKIPHLPYKWRPSRLWYQFTCWAWKRFTTVKPRKLNHSWCDRCTLLPHLMFEVLADFVEKEEALNCHVDWGFDVGVGHVDEHGYSPHSINVDGVEKLVGQEIKDIYDWWVKNDYSLPYESESIYNEYTAFCDIHRTGNWIDGLWDTPESREKSYELLKEHGKREDQLLEETKEMMRRLVNIYPFLWT